MNPEMIGRTRLQAREQRVVIAMRPAVHILIHRDRPETRGLAKHNRTREWNVGLEAQHGIRVAYLRHLGHRTVGNLGNRTHGERSLLAKFLGSADRNQQNRKKQ